MIKPRSLIDFIPYDGDRTRIAVIEQTAFRRKQYSYQDMQYGIRNVIRSLQQRDLREGDKVILWGENSARWMMTFYACLSLRIIVVPMDASFSQEFVEKVRVLTRAKLVCSDSNGAAWNKMLEETNGTVTKPETVTDPKTLLEIIFTSGTTGEPKGVMITHGNLLANLVPIYDEYQKYRRYAKPFSPIRFVHLIPTSHLFGQVMALFIPQMLNGTVIFTSTAAPQIILAVQQNRASVITCVPQELSLLHKHVSKHHRIDATLPVKRSSTVGTVLSRWWKYRSVHRVFGWKFWAFIVGGAKLAVEEEEFWTRLGFAVVQGYGMTETAPSITITHPFKGMKAGYVGKTLPGLEIRIAEDGEILVRGPHVTPGYYENAAATEQVLQDGWLHTGDLGRFDNDGNLQLLGRKKEMIVTSEGLNVYPDDVERVLNEDSRVVESAVVARETGSRSVVHAVLVLQNSVFSQDADEIVRNANQKLETFQRIQSYSIWPQAELPRTSIGKLKRLAIAQGTGSSEALHQESAEDLAKQFLSGASLEQRSDEELQLSSLDRVELLMELESAAGVAIDEAAFAKAKTYADVAKLVDAPRTELIAEQHYPYWKWTEWLPVRLIRYFTWYALVFRVMPRRMKVVATGLENLKNLRSPVFFVSNHQSIVDEPAILKALPDFRWRKRLAPAMGANRARLDLYAAGIFFNTYPLPSTSVGLRGAIQRTGELVDCGYCPLVFPEGERTPNGALRPFRPGIGVLVNHTKIPVVPIFLRGAYEIWPIQSRGPLKKGIVSIHFHQPIDFAGQSPAQITTELEKLYRKEFEG